MKPGWAAVLLIGFTIVITLLAAGIIMMVSSRPRGEPIPLIAPPTPPLLVVQVSGAVANPGVYHLPAGSRVLDAIQAAGGLLPTADATLINQATLLQDGLMVWVPSVTGETPPPPGATSAVPEMPSRAPTAGINVPLNINTATAEELETLPGIGPELAGRIVVYRNTYGPFAKVGAIVSVSGIGPKILENIKELITVTAPSGNELP
jgi:competence protein ComEA